MCIEFSPNTKDYYGEDEGMSCMAYAGQGLKCTQSETIAESVYVTGGEFQKDDE